KAQQLLVQRGEKSAIPALAKLVATAPDPRTRLHALWTIDGLDRVDPRLVERALEDTDPMVRASAVRLTEDRLRKGDDAVIGKVVEMTRDPSVEVRWQVAASLGELPADRRIEPLLDILVREGDD